METYVVGGVLGLVALVAFALVMHFVESIGDRIAYGRSPRRHKDATPDEAIDAAQYDRKRADGSGFAGF